MRPRLLLVISTVAIAFVAGCGSSSAGSKASGGNPGGANGVQTKSGQQIVAAAVAATKRQNSFHFVEMAATTQSSVRIVGDVGSAAGEQHITVQEGKQSGHITVLLAKGMAYFTGDVFGLEGFTGLTKALATGLAGKWISVPSSNVSFATIAASLAVKTAADQLVKLTGKLSRGKTSTQLGHRAVAVKATEKTSTGSLSLTLYVDTTGAALPIRVEGTTHATGGATRSIDATFTNWGEPVHLSAPQGTEPISSVKSLAG
jgi:hypothetical protein